MTEWRNRITGHGFRPTRVYRQLLAQDEVLHEQVVARP